MIDPRGHPKSLRKARIKRPPLLPIPVARLTFKPTLMKVQVSAPHHSQPASSCIDVRRFVIMQTCVLSSRRQAESVVYAVLPRPGIIG
jgi:hypothetical protein